MKRDMAKFRKIFMLMLCCYWLIPLSFLLMIFADFNISGIRRVLAYGVGILFWTGTLSGTVLLIILDRARKKDSSKEDKTLSPGAFAFFRTKQAKPVDMITIPVTAAAVVMMIIKDVPQTIKFAVWSLALFMIIFHSAVNGRNYIYLNKRAQMKG
ncbi:MAG: hypothetical protein IJM38_03060 [Ruminococcus sp.]|nr:hypothetical protein [Ruminococcus sp.]